MMKAIVDAVREPPERNNRKGRHMLQGWIFTRLGVGPGYSFGFQAHSLLHLVMLKNPSLRCW